MLQRPSRSGTLWALWGALLALAASVVAGCALPFTPDPPPPQYFTLDAGASIAMPSAGAIASTQGPTAAVIRVVAPQAGVALAGNDIVYVLQAHRLGAYAYHHWIGTPSQMLEPLIVQALSQTRAYAAVVEAPSPVRGDWEIRSDIVRLQHEIVAARLHFTLRVVLVDVQTQRVALAQEFDASAPVAQANPAAAVAAANEVVATVLHQVAAACAAKLPKPGLPPDRAAGLSPEARPPNEASSDHLVPAQPAP